ncbi:hypothetical protein P9112_007668 [Eukaryota sp. TZLM1-RC]
MTSHQNPLLVKAETGSTRPCTYQLPDVCFGVPSRRFKPDYDTTKSCLDIPEPEVSKQKRRGVKPVKIPDITFGVTQPMQDPIQTKKILAHEYEANTSHHGMQKTQRNKSKSLHTKASLGHAKKSSNQDTVAEPFKMKKFLKVPPRVQIPPTK